MKVIKFLAQVRKICLIFLADFNAKLQKQKFAGTENKNKFGILL
jgi:hypothetical protein